VNYRGMITGKNTIGVLLAMTQGWGKPSANTKAGSGNAGAVVIGWDQTLSWRIDAVNYQNMKWPGRCGRPVSW